MAEEVKPFHWNRNIPKGELLEAWFLSVMMDKELDPAELRIAWCLSFLFNSSRRGAAWPSNDTIANAINMKPDTVRKKLGSLVRRGHLVKFKERIKGDECRVFRPALAFTPKVLKVGQRVSQVRPDGRNDGTPYTDSLEQGIPSEAAQGIPHIFRGYPDTDPDWVQDGSRDAIVRPDVPPAFDRDELSEVDEIERRYREIRQRVDQGGPNHGTKIGSVICSMCTQPATKLDAAGSPFCDEHEIYGDLPIEELR